MLNLELKTYGDPQLSAIWAGYVEGPVWSVFFPADGSQPVVVVNPEPWEEIVKEDVPEDAET